MRQLILLLLIITVAGCNSGRESSESSGNKLPDFGEFVQKDSVIYGLFIVVDLKGKPKYGKPVKAKVLKIGQEGVTMKAIERVEFNSKAPRRPVWISPGEIWTEEENELFRTREEALEYLARKNLLYTEK